MPNRLRALAGVIAIDWPRYRRALAAKEPAYLALCNRDERLLRSPDGHGFACDWQWTSDLHAPKHVRSLARELMRRAVADHPIRRRRAPIADGHAPEVTFVIGHRGTSRLEQLLATIDSIAGQEEATIECVVVEQDVEPQLPRRLPAWVRYVHTPPAAGMPYCRGWAFNVGARCARGQVLVLHDNDMLVPADYAREILRRIAAGYEAVNLKRFIFYLDEGTTRRVVADPGEIERCAPSVIVQNLEAGGSVAIARDAFFRIGGMDEGFVGWGGEDNELWERAQTLAVWPYGYLPLVHLWHAAQPEKDGAQRESLPYYRQRASLPARERIADLTARRFGDPRRTDPAWSPASQGG